MVAVRVAVGRAAVPRVGPSVAAVVASSSAVGERASAVVVARRRAVVASASTESAVGRGSSTGVGRTWSRPAGRRVVAVIDIVIATASATVLRDWRLL